MRGSARFLMGDESKVALPTLTIKAALAAMSRWHRISINYQRDKLESGLVRENGGFDVLVIGSGASGLAAAVSASRAGARVAVATKGSIQSCNSAKAQGGIRAAMGEDDSPELHAQDIWRSSHETADLALVEILTGEAPSAIHWLEELGVEFTKEDGGQPLPPPGGGVGGRE